MSDAKGKIRDQRTMNTGKTHKSTPNILYEQTKRFYRQSLDIEKRVR